MSLSRPIRLLSLALVAAAAGCGPGPCPPGSSRKADGLCYRPDSPDDTGDTDGEDTDADTDVPAVEGDPIRVIGFEGDQEPGGRLLEWTDSVVLDDELGAVCGVIGVGLVDLVEGTTLSTRPTPPCLRMAGEDGVIIASDRESAITILDVSNPPEILEMGFIRYERGGLRHEDIAMSDSRILVAWHGNGAELYDPQANLLGTLPATDAFAAGLHENRAVISDAEELVLWDVTDPAFPTELSRVPLPGEGRDIEFDGSRVAIAMGGAGVGVWDVVDDTLVPVDRLVVPGAGLAVSLDGDEVWVGSWEHTILLRVVDGALVSVGHEAPRFSAMGIDAKDGKALVGDWHGHMTLERVPDVAAPELLLGADLYFTEADPVQFLRVENHGQVPLQWTVTDTPDGFVVDPSSVTLEPDGVVDVRVQGPGPLDALLSLPWTSNDPDEPSGEVFLLAADSGVGSEHDDFALQGFEWPSRDLSEYTLSSQRGKVVVLAYFALF